MDATLPATLPAFATHREAIAYHHARAAQLEGKARKAHLLAAEWHSTALTTRSLTAIRKSYEHSARADRLG